MLRACAIALLSWGYLGCGGADDHADAALSDAAPDATRADDDAAIDLADAGPADALVGSAPALPVMGPCLAGWRELPASATIPFPTCDPWPATGRGFCTSTEVHWPGEPMCVPLRACPAGDYAADLPTTGRILYVSKAGGGNGTGTLARPFPTLAAALAVATDGTVIALGKGTWVETTIVPAGVTVWGACPAQTILAPPRTTGRDVTLQGGSLRNLRVNLQSPGALEVAAGAGRAATLTAVLLLTSASSAGPVVVSGDLTARELMVNGGTFEVAAGATATVDRLQFLGTALLVRGRLIARQLFDSSPSINVAGELTADGVVLDNVWFVNSCQGRCTFRDALITNSRGIWASGTGGALTVQRARLQGARGIAVLVETGSADLADISIEQSYTDFDQVSLDLLEPGYGLAAAKNAVVRLQRGFLSGNELAGAVAHTGASQILNDVTVVGNIPAVCGGASCVGYDVFAVGLGAYSGATMTVRNFLIAGNALCGLQLADGGAFDLENGTIRGHRIGANVQSSGFDFTRLGNRVLYIDNVVNIDSETLPLPPPPPDMLPP